MLIPKELILEAKEKFGENAAYLIAKDLNLQNFDERNLKALCPFHKEDSASFIWNIKDNYFHCFACGKIYGILDHFIDFYSLTYLDAVEKLFDEVNIKYRFGERGVKSTRNFRYPHYDSSEKRDLVEQYLSGRGISKETLDYTNTQQDINGNIVFHFFDENDVLILVKYRPSHEIKKGEDKTWCQKNTDTKHILYNINKVNPTKPLVITEGEIDCLSVIECGYKNVVSIPLGANNLQWIETNWDFLEQFDKIIVWSDNDQHGIALRQETCARLGTWRSYYIDVPKYIEKDNKTIELKDANDVLIYLGKEEVLNFIDNAQEIPIQNVIDLSEVADFDIENAPGLYTGFEELDKWLCKLVLGNVLILTGRNGHGKSVLLNQLFIAEPLNQGMDIFVYSAEMGKPLLKSWIELVMAGRDFVTLKEGTIHKIDPEALKLMRNWYKGRIQVYDNDKDLSADSILDRLETVVRKIGIKVAVLDNLLTIDLGVSSSNDGALWQEQKKFIVRLVNFASKYNILIVLVAHPRKMTEFRRLTSEDIAGSADITNLVAYVLSIHRYTKTEREGELDGKGKYRKGKEPEEHDCVIDLFKNRITGHQNKEIKLYFDYLSYRFYTTGKNLYKRFKWDKRDTSIPTKDPNNHSIVPEAMQD